MEEVVEADEHAHGADHRLRDAGQRPRADAPHCRLICLGITPRHALANSDAQRGGLSVGYTWQLVRFPESFQCKDIHAIDACEVLSMCNLQWP